VFGFFKRKRLTLSLTGTRWWKILIFLQGILLWGRGELARRQVPGLEMSRVDFSEGGILSANREYLRMSRKGLSLTFALHHSARPIFSPCALPNCPPSYAHGKSWSSFSFCLSPADVVPNVWNSSWHHLFIVAVGFGVWFLRNTISLA